MRVRVGTLEELRRTGCLTAKAGRQPVCVFWHGGQAWAIDDRCPHMGFPLHRGSVDDGIVTCHWHHARFDLATGGTLDPFADDARAYPVEVEGGEVVVVVEPDAAQVDRLHRRLEEGLEQGLTLVVAKAVLGLLDAGVSPSAVVGAGVEFGCAYRREGWGAGLTVLVAMANLLPHLDAADHPLALVHGLAFVSRDTRGHAPSFPLSPLGEGQRDLDRLAAWYRRFVETRSADAAERTLVTAIAAADVTERGGEALRPIADMVYAAVTDHVFLDGGHALDFTTKAFEALDHLGPAAAGTVLPTLVGMTARASREEERARWRHPHDLVALIDDATARLSGFLAAGGGAGEAAHGGSFSDGEVGALGWALLAEDPREVVEALCSAASAGASPEQLGRALAFAAALRITRFHTQNDHGDWDVVHHAFTFANAVHQGLLRAPSPELLRAVVHGALKVFLDRFLNVPAARLPDADHSGSADGSGEGASEGTEAKAGDLDELQACWDTQGNVDRAGAIAYRWLRSGGDPARLVAALGRALLAEDAGFHWFQTVEAAVRQFHAWPPGSDEGRLILIGAARFLAAHTPTRRELPQVVRIATRLGRGEPLYEEPIHEEEPRP